jgi:hypothetical protein
VIASGCIPAHASYFTVYELLKRFFHYENAQFEILHTAMIGALTTFAHDFFITPSDSMQTFTLVKQIIYSDKAETVAMFSFEC